MTHSEFKNTFVFNVCLCFFTSSETRSENKRYLYAIKISSWYISKLPLKILKNAWPYTVWHCFNQWPKFIRMMQVDKTEETLLRKTLLWMSPVQKRQLHELMSLQVMDHNWMEKHPKHWTFVNFFQDVLLKKLESGASWTLHGGVLQVFIV